jgi:hypothetical protein
VKPIYGPDGHIIGGQGAPKVEVRDATVTYAKGDEAYSADAEQLLMAMARAQRDGMSHKQIIAEFGLVNLGPNRKWASRDATDPRVLERALARGRAMLDQAIAEGREPAETKRTILVED